MIKPIATALLFSVSGVVAATPPNVADLYQQNCASCHGENLSGGAAGSLLDDEWTKDGATATLTSIITEGISKLGMPAWRGTISTEGIRALALYIQEQHHEATITELAVDTPTRTLSAVGHNFHIETLYIAEEILWALEFLPNGSMLTTRRDGELLHLSSDGSLIGKIKGLPQIWHHIQGGLLDITLHPNYETNGWIYLAYASSEDNKKGATKIARGKIRDGHWVEHQDIFESEAKFHSDSGRHFGARIVLQDGYVYFATGERANRDSAQDLGSPDGKVFRLHEDGGIPSSNPFSSLDHALPGIWTYGHRNPQGMAIEPATGLIWELEHGPRGGDELNVIKGGMNYGWPDVTYGINYDGTPITSKTAMKGTEQPKHYWVPSISPASMVFYTGDMFPKWKGKLLIGGLSVQDLQIYTLDQGEVLDSDVILTGQGRIRELNVAADGSIRLIVTIDGKGHILALTTQSRSDT